MLIDKSKEYWENNKRNSIILIDECTAFMNKAKDSSEEEINNKIAQLIQNSANEYHAMLFMTTNYPAKLDKIYANYDLIPLFMPLDPPNKENALEVFKYYAPDKNIDFEKVINEFEKKCKNLNSRYSNGQIKQIIELTKTYNNGKISTESLIETIQHSRPEITQEDLEKYQTDKETFS